MPRQIDLIGDGIENPWNAKALIDTAAAFNSNCLFRDRKNLLETMRVNSDVEQTTQLISCEDVARLYSPVVALENLKESASIYGFRMPTGSPAALIAGNERFGISQTMKSQATHLVQIPMPGSTLNTLNVAAASAVALYYLQAGGSAKLESTNHPEKRRPELLLIGGDDHIELGSTIRSAGAFGWDRLVLEDRRNVWFGCDRVTRSEGRGAARRGRNAIHLIPAQRDARYQFKQVIIVSSKVGAPIQQANLHGGSTQLLVMPDESCVDVLGENWDRLGADLQLVRIEVPGCNYNYRYRLFSSIALAEIARQVGQKSGSVRAKLPKRGRAYETGLEVLPPEGESILLDDLAEY